jgi:hypothetical protein
METITHDLDRNDPSHRINTPGPQPSQIIEKRNNVIHLPLHGMTSEARERIDERIEQFKPVTSNNTDEVKRPKLSALRRKIFGEPRIPRDQPLR